MERTWSNLQLAIFDVIQNGEGNMFVDAVAGSGKSTTMVEMTKRCVGTRIFLAFNKPIADELAARGVYAKTFHSICNSAVSQFKKTRDVDTRKLLRLFNEVKTRGDDYIYSSFVRKLVGLGKQGGVGCYGCPPNNASTWSDIRKHHGMELESEAANVERAYDLACELLDASNRDPMYDFDDMLYLPIRENLVLPRFDWVFVDEAQDTNMIQRLILKKMMHENTRFVAVGDPKQSIYGFRGADSSAIETLIEDFNCVKMPLSVTYRCDTAIVDYAKQWVPQITARDGAGEGVVKTLPEWAPEMFEPEDLIVCRTMKALLQLGFKMIRAQMPCNIKGKEIGEGLRALLKRMNSDDLDIVSQRLVEWRDREMVKAMRDSDEAASDTIQDKAEALLSVIDGMPEDKRTLNDVYAVIDYLFAPDKVAPTLTTIHRAKGLEARRVFWLNRTQCPPKWVKPNTWQMEQEENLMYVASTRAKQELYFIDEDDMHSGFRRGAAATQ